MEEKYKKLYDSMFPKTEDEKENTSYCNCYESRKDWKDKIIEHQRLTIDFLKEQILMLVEDKYESFCTIKEREEQLDNEHESAQHDWKIIREFEANEKAYKKMIDSLLDKIGEEKELESCTLPGTPVSEYVHAMSKNVPYETYEKLKDIEKCNKYNDIIKGREETDLYCNGNDKKYKCFLCPYYITENKRGDTDGDK